MKIIAAAIAFAFAMPAAAQTAPAPTAPPTHDMGNMQHHAPADHSRHQEHGDGGCCADRDGDGRMDCCQDMAQAPDRRNGSAQPAPPAGAQPPAHHNH
jgi:hypothetical protein